jgi:hypothetical protein
MPLLEDTPVRLPWETTQQDLEEVESLRELSKHCALGAGLQPRTVAHGTLAPMKVMQRLSMRNGSKNSALVIAANGFVSQDATKAWYNPRNGRRNGI